MLEMKPTEKRIIAKETVQEQVLAKFLKHVTFAEHIEVDLMLTATPTLSLLYGNFTDPAGRFFEQVTGFQYALLVLDWRMWEIIIASKYMTKEIIIEQVNNLENSSWMNKYDIKANMRNLVDALFNYAKNYNYFVKEQRVEPWGSQIRCAQLLLPAHFVKEYYLLNYLYNNTEEYMYRGDYRNLAQPSIINVSRDKIIKWYQQLRENEHTSKHAAWLSCYNGYANHDEPVFWNSRQYVSEISHSDQFYANLDANGINKIYEFRSKQQEYFINRQKNLANISRFKTFLLCQYRLQQYSTDVSEAKSLFNGVNMLIAYNLIDNNSSEQQDLAKFLKHIYRGEQDLAEMMLGINHNLLSLSGDLTDCSGRTFKQITGFQYSLWALDWRMWEMFLRNKYMTREIIKKQINDFKQGTWVKEHNINASWDNLISALQEYVRNYNIWTKEQRSVHWQQQVSIAQALLPAHVIDEYRSMNSDTCGLPAGFDELNVCRSGVGNWYEIETDGSDSLPKSCGWLSFAGGCGQIGAWDPNWTNDEDEDDYRARSAREDFEKLGSLYAIRIKQRNELINTCLNQNVEGGDFKQEEPTLQEILLEKTSINSCKIPKLSS